MPFSVKKAKCNDLCFFSSSMSTESTEPESPSTTHPGAGSLMFYFFICLLWSQHEVSYRNINTVNESINQ